MLLSKFDIEDKLSISKSLICFRIEMLRGQ